MLIQNMEGWKALWQAPKRKILVTTHVNPDGDALGASLGLWHFLRNLGHEPYVVLPNEYPYFLEWLPGIEKVYVATQLGWLAIQKLFLEADGIACLDFNTPKRTEILSHQILNCGKPILMIDHHETPDLFANYIFHDHEASSTCELVYRFIEYFDLQRFIDLSCATCLYTGLVTDTGCFRYSLSARVHEIAHQLLQRKVEAIRVHHLLFNNSTEERMRFLGYMLKERLVVMGELGFAYFVQNLLDAERYGFREGDSEGIVNYALSIKGIDLACYITEREGDVKLSFRSVGEVPAIYFAKYFGGGGHHNAAGAKVSNLSVQEVEKQLVELVRRNRHLIRSVL